MVMDIPLAFAHTKYFTLLEIDRVFRWYALTNDQRRRRRRQEKTFKINKLQVIYIYMIINRWFDVLYAKYVDILVIITASRSLTLLPYRTVADCKLHVDQINTYYKFVS